MASAGSSLIKGALVVLFIGAVFVGLNFMLEEVPETSPVATTPTPPEPSSPAPSTEVIEDPAVTEARQMGKEIGRRVGEQIGRRVGEQLVARLDAEDLPADEPAEETKAAEMAEPETEPAETETTAAAAESAEEEQPAPAEDKRDYPVVQRDDPGIPISTVRSESGEGGASTESGAESGSSKRWWTASANGKGLRVIYVGQSVTRDNQKGISVILSGSLADGQAVENLIEVGDHMGQDVEGSWRVAPHGKSLFFRVPRSGQYQLSFSPALKDANGDTLGMELSGPVIIR